MRWLYWASLLCPSLTGVSSLEVSYCHFKALIGGIFAPSAAGQLLR